MSVAGNRKTTIGLDHSGAPHAGAFVPKDHPAAMPSHPHAVPNRAGTVDHANAHADLGVAPKPKRALTTSPPITGGMQAKSRRDGQYFHGLSGQDLSRYDADGPDPLSGAPVAKRLTEPAITPTMRSRTSPGLTDEHFRALGKLLLSTATASPDDKAALAHYGIGVLPSSTTEKS